MYEKAGNDGMYLSPFLNNPSIKLIPFCHLKIGSWVCMVWPLIVKNELKLQNLSLNRRFFRGLFLGVKEG